MNNIIRTIIAEDDKDQRHILKYFLRDYPEFKIIGEVEEGGKALKQIKSLYPDVVFMDIELPQKNGIEIVRSLKKNEYTPIVIFITSFPQYAIEGFDLDAVDYLVKPINPSRLERTVKKIKYSFKPEYPIASSWDNFIQYLTIQISNRSFVVNVSDIAFIYVEDGVVFAKTKQKTGTLKYRSLKQLEKELDPRKFVRVHRKYLVNVDKIEEIISWFKYSYKLLMKDDDKTEIELSRRGTKALRKIIRW